MEHKLSKPPHATSSPCVGSNAHVITHDERKGIALILFSVAAFQTISLPKSTRYFNKKQDGVKSTVHRARIKNEKI